MLDKTAPLKPFTFYDSFYQFRKSLFLEKYYIKTTEIIFIYVILKNIIFYLLTYALLNKMCISDI